MIRSSTIAALAVLCSTVALAEGPINTIDRGHYVCELPGDAASGAGIPQPARNFTIQTYSRYLSHQGGGTYLRRGERVEMTSGPRKGEAYKIVHPGFLRLIDVDGKVSRLRCVRED